MALKESSKHMFVHELLKMAKGNDFQIPIQCINDEESKENCAKCEDFG